jgi:hypothetical protein
MKRHVLFGTMLSAALAVGLSAQTGSSGSQTAGQQGTGSQNQQQVTVTGCLMEGAGMSAGASASGGTSTGTATSTGTSGTQTGTQSGTATQARFHLTNAKITPADKEAASSTGTGTTGTGTAGTASGTSGTQSATADKDTKVQLIGGDQQDLQRYVNSQVEITGVLLTNQSDRSRSGAGTGTGTASGTGTGTGTGTGSATAGGASNRQSGMQQDVQRVRVTSVRQLSTSCSGQ